MSKIPVHFSPVPPQFSDIEIHGTLLSKNWSGQAITHPVRYLFWVDQIHFYFLVKVSGNPGLPHPDSQASEYQSELWKYDVAEFFLQAADRSCYLEVNLAPNGAWWSSIFTQPRQEAHGQPSPIPEVLTKAHQQDDSWQAMTRLPLSWLQEHFDFGKENTLNATFILNSPEQIFLTASDLGDGDPNFHRPDQFPSINPIALT